MTAVHFAISQYKGCALLCFRTLKGAGPGLGGSVGPWSFERVLHVQDAPVSAAMEEANELLDDVAALGL